MRLMMAIVQLLRLRGVTALAVVLLLTSAAPTVEAQAGRSELVVLTTMTTLRQAQDHAPDGVRGSPVLVSAICWFEDDCRPMKSQMSRTLIGSTRWSLLVLRVHEGNASSLVDPSRMSTKSGACIIEACLPERRTIS